MAHGLSLELAEIKVPKWRPCDPAKLAAERKEKRRRRFFSKKLRNQYWREMRRQMIEAADPTGLHRKHGLPVELPMTRQQYLVKLRRIFNVTV